VGLVLAGTIH